MSLLVRVNVNVDVLIAAHMDAGLDVNAFTFDFAQQLVCVQTVNALLPFLREEPLHARWLCEQTENKRLFSLSHGFINNIAMDDAFEYQPKEGAK